MYECRKITRNSWKLSKMDRELRQQPRMGQRRRCLTKEQSAAWNHYQTASYGLGNLLRGTSQVSLELELIQSHMAQKPVLRGEVGCACAAPNEGGGQRKSKITEMVIFALKWAIFGGNSHRGALRGTPGSVCPQPEPNATELPSCAPKSANATELPSCAPISARSAQRRRRQR